MAALSREAISSNWKQLQEKIRASDHAKKPQGTKDAPGSSTAGVKRKRAPAGGAAKKAKPTNASEVKVPARAHTTKRRRTMGNTVSSMIAPLQTIVSNKDNSDLIRDHDISPTDLAIAYGTPSTTVGNTLTYSSDAALANTGLHPTHKAGKYVAVDCEMVGTGPPPSSDHLLARVSVVNFHGQQIYDSYVLPHPTDTPITDYRTAFSGIRPSHLTPGIARPFPEVQAAMSTILKDRILVGHALKNDLAVLMLSHPKRDIRDTARYAKYRISSKGKAPALRNLAREELGVQIQAGEHSSVEDARAAMQLYKKEKVGFEEDNRRIFGQARRKLDVNSTAAGKNAAKKESEEVMGDEDSGLDEGSEFDELDDDEVEDGGQERGTISAQTGKSKKKRKKKKRTKRK